MDTKSCNKYKLEDLIDIKHFQNLQDRLNEIYSFPSSIIDNEGNILTATAWQDICVNFHRKNKECLKACIQSDKYILEHLDEANPAVTYKCPHGLVDNATPIIIEGVHYGNFFTGQFFLEEPDIDFFKTQAKKFGFPESPYLEAVKKVPVWTKEQLNSYLFFIKGLITIISESGLKNLKEIKSRELIEESEKRYRSVIETVNEGIILQDASGKILSWNKGAEEIFGISAKDAIGQTSTGKEWSTIHEDGSKYEGNDHPSMRTLRTGKSYKNEIMGVYRSSEDLRWISVNTNPLFHKTDEKPYAVAISFSDITDLKNEKDTSQKYLDLAGVMILSLNEKGIISLINKKGCEILEGTENELLGRNFFDLFTPENIVEDVKKVYENLILGQIDSVEYDERKIITLSGAEKIIAWHNTILKDKNDKIIGTLSSGEDITEKRQAEEALKDSEEKYRTIVENVNDGIFIHDFKGKIIDVNENVCRMVGYKRDELIGSNLSTIDSPENTSNLPERMNRLVSQDSIVFEGRHIRKDGLAIPTEVSAKVVSREGEGIIQGFVRDISERKKAEQKLSDSERKMKSIFRAAPVGIGVVIDRIFKEINGRFCEMTGYSREELIGQNSRIIYPSDEEYEYVGARKYKDINKYGSGSVDTKFKCKDGKIIDVILSSTPLDLSDLTLGVTFTALEITKRKRAEQDLKESEERFRDLAEMLPEAVFEADLNMKLTFVNRQAFSMFGYTQEDFDKGINGFDMLVPDDRKKAYENIQKKIKGGMTGVNEYLALRKNGTKFPVLFHTNTLIKDEVITGFRGLIVDISKQKMVEEHLRQAQKMEGIGTLAGGIAHDFNNILSPIMLHAEMAMEELPPDDPLQHSMSEIYRSGMRARELVKQILTFARKGSEEKIVLKSTPVIQEAINFLRSTIPTTIDIQLNMKADNDTLSADPTQLNQIVMNLATNAAHAMRENGGVLEIILDNEEIATTQNKGLFSLKPGKFLKLSVRDEGTGIPPEAIDRIFEPYYTNKKVGEGTGLGLATVHGIVQKYGGSISVDSKLGRGTTFNVYLPLSDEKTYSTVNRRKESPKGNEHILFVDDEKAAVDVNKKMLEKLGYKVTARTSSIEALEAFRNNPEGFDLIITDMTMPNMTGTDLAEQIMSIRHKMPVILCTGFSEKIDEKKAKEMGIRSFIMKPIVMSEMSKTIREILDNR